MSEGHAKLSASGSSKWINCPGSIGLEAGFPNESTVYASEGTAAHDLASKCLENREQAIKYLGDFIEADGEEFEVNHEMVDAVQQYLDYCHGLEGQHEFIETRVEYSRWMPKNVRSFNHEGEEVFSDSDGWGTSDYIKISTLYDDDTHTPHHTINVVDLKYGKGVLVDAEKNSQAMLYALGVIQSLGLFFDFKDTDIVNCVVVQPRKDSISEYKISIGELLKWAEEVVVPKAKEALGDSPSFTSGEKQCRFCRAKAVCPTLAMDSMKTASGDFKDLTKEYTLKDKNKLTNKEIGTIMEKIPALKIWADSIEAYAFNELTDGRVVPGYKLVTGKAGNKSWVDDIDDTLKSLDELGIPESEVTTRKISTPTQVEKILKVKKVKPAVIKDLWKQSKGKPTITKRSDKRKEIESETDAAFKDLTNLV